MNRRTLLTSLFGAGAAVALDTDELLWTRKKLISIPKRSLPFTAWGMTLANDIRGNSQKLVIDWEAPIGSGIVITAFTHAQAMGDQMAHTASFLKETGNRKQTVLNFDHPAWLKKRPPVSIRIDVQTDSKLDFKMNQESFTQLAVKARKVLQSPEGDPRVIVEKADFHHNTHGTGRWPQEYIASTRHTLPLDRFDTVYAQHLRNDTGELPRRPILIPK